MSQMNLWSVSSTLSCVHLNCCSAAHKAAAQHKHSFGELSHAAPLAEALHTDGQCMAVVWSSRFNSIKTLRLGRNFESRGAGRMSPTRLIFSASWTH